jgi:hypothetical protein
LLHAALAQRRQHVADVVEEHLVGPHHQHAVAHQPTPVLEQQEGRTVQAHRGLARAGAALHHETLVERGPDDDVLLGLDGSDDLAHRAGARGADLGEHRIGDAGSGSLVIGVVELLVEVRGQLAIRQREPATVCETERVSVRGSIERGRDRCPPIHHHRVVLVVLDVAATDVPAVARVLGDTTEEIAGARGLQILQGFRDRDLDVLLGDLVGGTLWVEPGKPFDHPVAAHAGKRHVRNLGR